jgi:CRP-like cAMP-binding protein
MPAKIASNPLRDLPFFAGLPDTLLWHLARFAEERKLAKDEVLFREGDERQVFAIVTSGTVVIEQRREGAVVPIATLGVGEVIGEGILLEENHHGTTAHTTEPTVMVCFTKAPLGKLLKEQPALYAALVGRAARIINERIKRANAALVHKTADTARIRAQVDQWIGSVTVLVPAIGCDAAMKLAREALDTGKTVEQLALEKKLLTQAQLDALLGAGQARA